MIDLPIVENRTSAPPNPVEDQCYYNSTMDRYYIRLDNSWNYVGLKSENDTFVLRYTTVSNPSTWTTTEYNSLDNIKSAISSAGNTLNQVEVYYGSLTQPSQRCRLIASDGNNEDDFARIERWKLINNIYTWEAIAIIYPKIVFNNQVVSHINFSNINLGDEEETYFNNILVHKLYPKIELEIIETSTPANSTVGYTPGETISLTYKYTNKGSLPILHNVRLWSDDNLNTAIDTIVNFTTYGQTNSFNRTYTVTHDDCLNLLKTKKMYFKIAYESEYNKHEDAVLVHSKSFKIAYETPYWDLTYVDINNNTVTQRFYNYDDIRTYLNTSVSTNLQTISITEGWDYE